MSLAYPKSININEKWCGGCKQFLSLLEFNKNKTKPGGLDSRCRRCESSHKLMRAYGISINEYERRFKDQEGLCAICGSPENQVDSRSGLPMRFAIDHDHACCPGAKSCGKCLRGLLCWKCNTAIGQFEDDKRRLSNAIQYIEKWELNDQVKL